MPKKQIKGEVVSNKMEKTLIVKSETIKKHSKYNKRFKTHKKFFVHCQGEKPAVGALVLIEEANPQSKNKKWALKEIIVAKEK